MKNYRMGSTVALAIFFGAILMLAIGNAVIEKIKKKGQSKTRS